MTSHDVYKWSCHLLTSSSVGKKVLTRPNFSFFAVLRTNPLSITAAECHKMEKIEFVAVCSKHLNKC